ncbi:MAG: hypothetical protein ACRC8S_22475 [Fimbriiglobus sp.]
MMFHNRTYFSLSLILIVSVLGLGCSTKPADIPKESAEKRNEDPWARIPETLRRENDLASTRKILEQLRTNLISSSDAKFLPLGMTGAEEKQLLGVLKLPEPELRDIRNSNFSPLDAHHLAECYQLRDIVRSLGLSGLPPTRQAEIVFDWMDRQILLAPWQTLVSNQPTWMPPAPPNMILLRGAGSGLERAYLFISLLNQLEIDAGLVGPPEAVTRTWQHRSNPQNLASAPSGPFWAVGVRVGAEVLLFDPWHSTALRGANQSILTLAQVRADAKLLDPYRTNAAAPWDTPIEDITKSQVFFSPALSSLARRWKRFEPELKTDLPPVQLATDLVAQLAQAKREAPNIPFAVWAPEADPYTLSRTLAHFLPPQEGGFSTNQELQVFFRRDLIPMGLFSIPEILRPTANDPGVPEVSDRLRENSLQSFVKSFVESPSPRERIQRGQFAEVTPVLVKKRDDYLKGIERLRTDRSRDENITTWLAGAKPVYTSLLRARDRFGADSLEFQAALKDIEAHWKGNPAAVSALLDMTISESSAAESTYLLAICRHEQAERSQLTYDRYRQENKPTNLVERARDQARAEWQEALGWWKRYLDYAPAQKANFPGRGEQAAKLSARVESRLAELPAR